MENQKLPNATAVLVLGILSILTCWCYGIIGVILGVIALFLSSSDLKLYRQNPQDFDNYQNLNVGRILAIIGLVLSALTLLFFIWVIAFFGMEAMQNPELMQERMRELQGM
jgi:hypothetical protein